MDIYFSRHVDGHRKVIETTMYQPKGALLLSTHRKV